MVFEGVVFVRVIFLEGGLWVYCFGKRNVVRLDLKEFGEGFLPATLLATLAQEAQHRSW